MTIKTAAKGRHYFIMAHKSPGGAPRPDSRYSFPMVTRCVCFNVSFADLKEVAEEDGLTTIEELREVILCGANCRFCVPYIERMLRTGQTEFPWPEEESDGSFSHRASSS